ALPSVPHKCALIQARKVKLHLGHSRIVPLTWPLATLSPRERLGGEGEIGTTLIASVLVNADCGLSGNLPKRAHATDTVPGIFLVRLLSFAFVPFQKSGDESFTRQSGQPYASRFTVTDNLVCIVKRNHLNHGSRLRSKVRDLVTIGWGNRLGAGPAHKGGGGSRGLGHILPHRR